MKFDLSALFASTGSLGGMSSHAPQTDKVTKEHGIRPTLLMYETGRGLELTAEPNPNVDGFNNCIIAHNPLNAAITWGRVDAKTAAVLAPLMKLGSIVVRPTFHFHNFNLKRFAMAIDVFATEEKIETLKQLFDSYVLE